MPEIDPVILQLRADVDKYLSDLRQTTTKVDDLLGRQEKQTRMLEDQFRTSADAIGGHLRGIAAAVAAAFSVDKITEYADAFTQIQNHLKVAGVAGEDLKAVQDRLFGSAQKYGVEVGNLASLFSTLTQASKESGASQQQVFTLMDSVSAAMKISGSSAEEASGALLQLGQAIRMPTIHAEEFNSLLEGMYPLLEAAASGSSKWGGSVAKLTNDVKNGKVSSSEFFQAILNGSAMLQDQAAKTTLTVAAGYTTLSNALTIYVGEADKTYGASATMGQALKALADNLDTIIPALAVLATALGVGVVANALRAEGAITGFAASVSSALGGPIGIAITALTVGFASLAAEGVRTEAALKNVEATVYNASHALADAQGKAASAASHVHDIGTEAASSEVKIRSFAGAVGEAAQKLYDLAKARQETAISDLEEKRRQASTQYTELWKQTSEGLDARVQGNGSTMSKFLSPDAWLADLTRLGRKTGVMSDPSLNLKDGMDGLKGAMDDYDAAILAAKANLEQFAHEGGLKVTPAQQKTKKQHGPTAAQIAAKHEEEMARLQQEQLQAQVDITKDSEDRAALSQDILKKEYVERVTKIKADKYYTQAQKDAQIAELNKLYARYDADQPGPLSQAIQNERNAAYEKRAADIAKAQYDAQKDALQAMYDLADSTDERRRIALDMVALEYKAKRAEQEAILNAPKGVYSEDERNAAAAQIKILDAQVSGKRTTAERANESPLQAYKRNLDASPGKINDQVEGYVVDELNSVRDSIRSAITKQLGITNDPLINGLLDMLIEQVLLKPIANALEKAQESSSGGGGGFFTSILSSFGSIFGRASGGPVQAGQMYRVNEAANSGNVEAFVPNVSGQIIPLGRTNATRAGGDGQRVFQISVDARNSVTPAGFAQQLSSQILQQAAAMDVQMGKAVSGAVPTRMRQYQRDGN